MESKPWYMSSTLWTNAVVFLAAILAGTGVVNIGVDEQTAIVAGIMAVINAALRLKTNQPVIKPGVKTE